MQSRGVKTVGTLDYVVIMLGLVFIADSIGDVFKSRRMRDCEDKKIEELEERVKKLEEKLKQKI